jgi:hypothetical protein
VTLRVLAMLMSPDPYKQVFIERCASESRTDTITARLDALLARQAFISSTKSVGG